MIYGRYEEEKKYKIERNEDLVGAPLCVALRPSSWAREIPGPKPPRRASRVCGVSGHTQVLLFINIIEIPND
jgi:hypothetical protein